MIRESEQPILLIEDDPIALMQLSNAINAQPGLTALTATSTAQAIRVSKERPPAVVVADALVGSDDGVEAAAQITASSGAPVIVVTAAGTERLSPALRQLHRVVVLSKPVEMDRLVAEIREALRRTGTPPAVDSEFLLATLYESARIGMCVTDEDRRFVRVNRAYCEHYGFSREELLGNEFTMVLPENQREYGAKMHDDFISGEVPEIPARWKVQRKSGEVRDVFVTAGRLLGTDGKRYKVTTISDVTDQMRHEEELARALEEKQILLREVHHRVKNNLNTLSAMLDLQRQQHLDQTGLADLLKVSINRIKTMSRIYERLNESDSESRVRLDDYLQTLARDLIGTTGGPRVSIATSADPLWTDVDNGISAGLIVNELVTNSVKHAANQEGQCAISVLVHAAERGIVIEVEDDGPGFPEGFVLEQSNSLGLQLVQAVAGQRKGRVEVMPGDHGHVVVRLPGAEVEPADR